MNDFFSESGISLIDFVTLSTYFLMTMTAFFGLKEHRQRWIHRTFLAVFVIQWFLVVASGRPPQTKFFATLLLISISTVEVVVTRKQRQEDSTSI